MKKIDAAWVAAHAQSWHHIAPPPEAEARRLASALERGNAAVLGSGERLRFESEPAAFVRLLFEERDRWGEP